MKKTLLSIAVASLTLFSGTGSASGIPTVDVAALAQNIVDMGNQIQQLEQALTQVEQGVMQIEEARQQVLEAQRAFDSINGLRDLGSMLNSDLYNQARNYLPSGWDQTLDLGEDISNGRYSSLRGFREGIRSADRLYSERSALNLPSDSAVLAQLDSQENIVLKARTESELSTEVGAQRMEELKSYKNRVNTLPDQKSTLDLQASMLAESLLLQNELIQVQNRRNALDAKTMVEEQQQRERALRLTHLPYDPASANARARAEMAYRED
jgi:type IV secretion system protein VirB5